MPWTTPETFTAGQTLTAASMNAISGNLTELSAIGSSAAWTAYTPTWTNLTVGNATQAFYYLRVGRLVTVHGQIVLGSSSSISGTIGLSPPVNMATAGYADLHPLGWARFEQSGYYNGHVNHTGTATRVDLTRYTVSGSYVISLYANATAPVTFTTGAAIRLAFSYEAAS